MLDSVMENLISSVVSGDNRGSLKECARLLESGVDPQDIVLHGLAPAMEALDSKCSVEDFDLLSIMLAGRCVLQVSDLLYSDKPTISNPKARVVLGTIKGDVHNLGKSIVKAVFMGSGYLVTDLGTGIKHETFVETALNDGADIILVSSLLTTTLPFIRDIKSMLPKGSDTLVVAGGAAVAQTDAGDLNVDYAAKDVFDGLRFCNGRIERL